MFSQDQLTKASQLAREIDASPWHVAISRDNRKAQILDSQGRSIFGGSWVLTPEEAEKFLALRSLFPILVKILLTDRHELSQLKDSISNLKEVFEELKHYEGLDTWAIKALDLIEAIRE